MNARLYLEAYNVLFGLSGYQGVDSITEASLDFLLSGTQFRLRDRHLEEPPSNLGQLLQVGHACYNRFGQSLILLDGCRFTTMQGINYAWGFTEQVTIPGAGT